MAGIHDAKTCRNSNKCGHSQEYEVFRYRSCDLVQVREHQRFIRISMGWETRENTFVVSKPPIFGSVVKGFV